MISPEGNFYGIWIYVCTFDSIINVEDSVLVLD